MQKILIIDDDRDMCLLLKRFLSRHGYEVSEVYSGKKALDMADEFRPDLVMCDFRLEDMDGNTVLVKMKEKFPAVPFIIITGYSDIKTAVEVMKLGAYDYVTKPLIPDEILMTIRKALNAPAEVRQPVQAGTSAQVATRPNDNREKKSNHSSAGEYIFDNSPVFQTILKQIDLVAPTNYSVIIYGESGSGKEAIAQEIHKRSKRKDKPFVAIDCGALSKELAGSELFGHEKGSFTGALNQKQGSFEIANGGTIFLDEIANLSYDIQVSLLRVVQERKMRRVGGVKDIELDVRIIIASNERLWDAARKGIFREDLYHRFNEFSIDVPPLRERKEDIMLFARHFLQLTNSELGKAVKGFSKEVEMIFHNYVWHGNLREMKNVVKRAVLLTDGDLVDVRTLPFEISNHSKLQFDISPESAQAAPAVAPAPVQVESSRPFHGDLSLKEASLDAEYEMILEALKKANYNKSKAARILNIDRKTLYNKMKQYQELNNL
ncbi:MAG: sigma-54-dependent Fis family transcriptional regulator [Chitinophagaceae bacterium]|nr:MAG: sigma-54-dependent Fis family transcriptional regulator [Chitinophagaceae bacterium]